jgi:hypothetical protein
MMVELRSLVWGDGVGWYRQPTLQLDGTAARHLIQALGIVQRRVGGEASDTLGPKCSHFRVVTYQMSQPRSKCLWARFFLTPQSWRWQ